MPRAAAVIAIVLAAGVLSLRAPVRAAQTPAPQTPPVFRAGVDVVQLDVSVLASSHRWISSSGL